MKKLVKISFILVIISSFIIIIIPTPTLNETNHIILYDNQGNQIHSELYQNKGNYTPLSILPSHTYQAFISIEDKNFYKHHGFDILRNIKAFFINLFSFSIKQGASTITQQYARNTLLNNKRTLSRKIKEAIYTIKIERKYSKEKILEGYLNSLYFGHGLTGIDLASEYYFSKTPDKLTIAESAMLAGICNAPSIYSPAINKEKAKQRQKRVLYQMLIQDYISNEEYNAALKEELTYNLSKDNPTNFYYYKDAVIKELKELGLYNKVNLRKGLKIYTNIDYPLNNKIETLLCKYKPLNPDIQVSIVIMKPFTNNIIHLTSGFDYNTSSYNRAINSSRQMGSTIKPLIYYLALANNFQPNTLLKSEETTFNIKNIGDYSPKNPNNKYANKEIDMIQALSLSDNIYALKTLLLIGSENLVKLLSLFDINDIEPLPSLALGTMNTSLLKITSIYNTFASLGDYHQPSFINKVTTFSGRNLYTNNNNKSTILNSDDCLILNQMLTSTFNSSLSSYLNATLSNYKPKEIYAAKSGTTNSDSYVIAFNPNYTIGIWIGTDSNVKLSNHTLSKQLFKEISNILYDSTSSWYTTNHNTHALSYNPNTHKFDKDGFTYYFKK